MLPIKVSDNFKKMAAKSVSSISFFIFTYIVLIFLATVLIALCGFLSFLLVSVKIHTITVMLAIGLISMGILIFIFLVKFIFQKHVTDLTHLTEISREQEPALFLMIEEIVKEVETDFPKKIYLSADVNASVFYDSSFWSMLLPVKKNLQIGIGLVNTVSVSEFKAIMAHEFGHFSQRSMKVGSYVYNVNKVIYNMLYDNDSYHSLAMRWAELNSYLAIFVGLAFRIITGIQWVLKKVYETINLSYMSLSREMEFHADEVAANVAGSRPLITALLRMELADHSYNMVLDYYNDKISESVKAQNIYSQQSYVMNFLATKRKLPFENDLPVVTLDHLNSYNKSKLVISDQWASHPSTEDRVRQLEKLNLESRSNDTKPASGLFSNMAALQDDLTSKLFSSVQYPGPVVVKTSEQFIDGFLEKYRKNSFHEFYNTYYDNRNPSPIDFETISQNNKPAVLQNLFSNEWVDKADTSTGMENDINLLRQIADGSYQVKTFDYDGIKYTPEDCTWLIPETEKKLQEMKTALGQHDVVIYECFLHLAEDQEKALVLKSLYQNFYKADKDLDNGFITYINMAKASGFMFQTTPFDVIKESLKILKEAEVGFKKEIKSMLAEEVFRDATTEEMKASFEDYLSNEHTYFYDQNYKSAELDILFACMNNYQAILSQTHFDLKKELLDFQVRLIGTDLSVHA